MFSVYLPLKMTTCAAKGCYNSSKKKVKMNYFPTDPDRRKADENANNVTYASKTMAMHICTE